MSDTRENSSNVPAKTQRARDTLNSIYSFYAVNGDSVERVPSCLSDSSREVPLIIQKDRVPSAEQTEL